MIQRTRARAEARTKCQEPETLYKDENELEDGLVNALNARMVEQ